MTCRQHTLTYTHTHKANTRSHSHAHESNFRKMRLCPVFAKKNSNPPISLKFVETGPYPHDVPLLACCALPPRA